MSPKSRKSSANQPKLPGELDDLARNRRRGQPVPPELKAYGLELTQAGFKPSQVAPLLRVTPECIRQWIRSGAMPSTSAAGASGASDNPDDSGTPAGALEPQTDQVTDHATDAVSPPVTATRSEGVPDQAVPDQAVSDQAADSGDLGPREKAVTAGPAGAPRDNGQGIGAHEEAGILELKKKHPSMGPAQIRTQLKRFRGWRLPVRLIGRILKKHGYQLVQMGSRPDGEVILRFEAPHRNALWQLDFVELRVGPDRVSLLLVLDDFSRFIVSWALMADVSSEAVVEVMRESIHRHGKPEAIYTDRGSPFLAWKESTSMSQFLESELIDHHVSPAYRPQGRGKVEALAATVQRELWQVVHFESVDQAREKLAEYIRWYNHGRAHMGIDGLTPADRFFGRWEEVKAQVDAVSRNRQGSQAFDLAPRILEEVGGPKGPVELLRLMVVDGQAEIRFLGHRIQLGAVLS